MSGLCLAGNGNWVRYFQDSNNIYYVNTNSIKVLEYRGRKYLEVKAKAEEGEVKGHVIWDKYHFLFDVENQKFIILKVENKKRT